MDIFHSPALFLVVAIAIGYVLPLVSARLVSSGLAAKYPEIEGIFTLIGAALTGLGAELAHAATATGVDFSWRAWATTAFTTLLTAMIGQAQTWRGSNTAANLRAKGSTAATPAKAA